jgi:hypothetical protein
MTDKKRGPFGRTGDGRSLQCQCSGCCGREWDDFPDTIEFRISSVGLVTRPFDFKGTMYKQPKNSMTCTCGNAVGVISYSSQLVKILTDTWPDDDSEACCVIIGIQGSCSDGRSISWQPPPNIEISPPYDPPLPFGECGWGVYFTWTGGDALAVWGDVTPVDQNPSPMKLASCDPIELEGGFGNSDTVPACILGNSIAPGIYFEIKEAGVSSGDPAEPCRYLCWATLDSTLYATLTSSCEELDGQVVELRYGNLAWSGDITVGKCERYTITVLQYDRYTEEDTCPLTITVQSVGGPVCFTDTQNLGTAPAPPPWGAGGTIAAACGCRCGDHTIDIDITE